MNELVVNIVIGILSLLIGFVVNRFFEKKKAIGVLSLAKREASSILDKAHVEGDAIKKNKIFQAKGKFLELKSEYEKRVAYREVEIQEVQRRVKDKERQLSREFERKRQLNDKLKKEQETLQAKQKALDIERENIVEMRNRQLYKLEQLSGLSAEKAKEQLVNSLKEEAHTEALVQSHMVIEEAKLNARKEAKKIIIQSIQRIGVEESVENCVTTFGLESDEIKGKIIGREGRNIRALESATGVDILIDETPEAVVLSCFDPVRREIARLALQKLVTDGRIHPARIEEVVAKTSKLIKEEIIEVGKRTVIDLGVHGLHPELIRIVGRMRYRSSYGQNLLRHSREVARLCAAMASDLGLNPKLAKRAGLLHDIGKVAEREQELPHALLGMEWAKKYGEKPEVINAIGAHHDEIEMTSLLSPVVQVCDAISGARPGVRNQHADDYIRRLKDLELLALGFDGVQKAYAIQAGRELRVFVESQKVNDKKTAELSIKISNKVQKEMTYPGQIKVTVIREMRAVNVAT